MNPRRLLTFSMAAFLSVGMLLFCVPATGRVPAATQTQGAAQTEEPPRISLEDFKAMLAANKPVTIIDVRYDIHEKIKGAIHIPLDQVETRLSEIPQDRPIVTYCA